MTTLHLAIATFSIPRFPYWAPHHQQPCLSAAKEEAQIRGCRL
ncbi:hypothetical protein [Nostoc mirabile]|nr:hypothetical protein [Nostoc mirabile]